MKAPWVQMKDEEELKRVKFMRKHTDCVDKGRKRGEKREKSWKNRKTGKTQGTFCDAWNRFGKNSII